MSRHTLIGLMLAFVMVRTAEAAIPDTVQLKPVEVIATANKQLNVQRTQRLDTFAMRHFRTTDLAEAIQQSTLVYIRENSHGGLATASFRGTAANHTVVLWNGSPINGPQLGMVDFSVIPMFFLDQVGVLNGEVAPGKNAGIGGVVMVDNVPDLGKHTRIEAIQTAGSFHSYGSYLSFSKSNGKLQSRSRLFRKYSRNDFSYLNTALWPAQRMKNEDASYAQQGFQQELNWQSRNLLMSFVSWNQWNDHRLPPIMTNTERGGNPEEYQEDQFSRNVLTVKYFADKRWVIFKSSFLFDNQHYFLRTTSAFAPFETVSVIDSKNQSHAWLNTIHATQLFGPHRLEAAVNFDRETVRTTNYAENKRRERLAVSTAGEFALTRAWSMRLAAKADFFMVSKPVIDPSIELTYQAQPGSGLRASFNMARISRFPTMNDLYWHPGGNEKLVPEQSLQSALHFSYTKKARPLVIESKVSVYASNIKDWIQWRPTSFRYWIPENVARVFARGVEMQQSIHWNRGLWHIKLDANYAYTVTTDESPVARLEQFAGRQLIYIPRHHGHVRARTDFGSWYFGATFEFVGERRVSLNDDQQFFDYLPAYHLLHLNAGYSVGRIAMSLKMNNVFNQDYQAVLWRPMPGRNVELSLSYQFQKENP